MNLARKIIVLVCAVAAALIATACAPQPAETTAQAPLQVFLVRHAEKQTGDDPALTGAGTARAELLADMLADAGIANIHSSDYKRTRDTAAPLAVRLGVEVELYDPRDLDGMAARLLAAGGRHLVVGHSNTTGELTERLGGQGGSPIVESYEYDRLYVVSVGADGAATSALLRFGESGE